MVRVKLMALHKMLQVRLYNWLVKHQVQSLTFRSLISIKPGIKPLNLDGVEPTDKNVTTNKWKIWSYEHMYTNNKNENFVENRFISYVKNRQSKRWENYGYIPVTEMKVDRDYKGKVTPIK